MELSEYIESEGSALKINVGVNQPEQINPAALNRLRKHRHITFSADEYVQAILSGDRMMLSRAITMIESINPTIRLLLRRSSKSAYLIRGNRLG